VILTVSKIRILALLSLFTVVTFLGRSEMHSDTAGSSCQTPSFAIVITPNVGNSLYSLAVGDLNGDGKPDLVTGNFYEDKVSVLIGNEAGNFSVASNLTTGARPSAVALGDFNQDGKLDVAVTRDFSTTVSVLLGTGTGSFSAPSNFTVGNNPLALVLADFNNDGKLDLATGNDGSNTISILLGNGAGSFASAPNVTGIRPIALVAADLNHDGKIDLAAANDAPGKVTIVLGDGSGGFGAANNFDGGFALRAIAAADFNGDGHPDIAVTNYSDCCTPAFVAILLGNGAGSFGAPTKFPVPSGPYAIAVADYNGDGNIDVATANINQVSSNVSVLLGNGNGALGTATNFNPGAAPWAIVARDVNLDGVPDLIAASSPNVATLLNACGGAPTPSPTPTPTPTPTPVPTPTPIPTPTPLLVISQVYADGGTPGATYQASFVELFNRGTTNVDLTGWSLRFASSATGTFDTGVSFVSSRGIPIQPGQYVLLRIGLNGASGNPVNDDFSAFSNPLDLSGKIALVRPNGSISTAPCPLPDSDIADFIGYGGAANCFEGAGPTGNLSNTTAAVRKFDGCQDTNNNSSDLPIVAPTPRNSSSPRHVCPNPIDDADFFVRQHYSDFLNRQPDAAGLSFWTNQIASCGTDQTCIEIKRINVSAAFFLSIEFQETGYLAYKTYKAAYGNLSGAPVPLRFDEFLPDTQMIGQGVVVNAPGWEQQLENNKVAFFNTFVARTRFTSAYQTSMSPADFVDALFGHAGVTPSGNERSLAIGEFGSASNTADQAARARALRRVAENGTLGAQEKNKGFVLMQYCGYLRRNPYDPPEQTLDFAGYNFWLNKLNQFNGNFVDAEMVKAFITSGEYRQRF